MQWSDDLNIETPEQIDVALELAGLGSRFVAQLIDWIIKWGVLLGLLFGLVIVLGLVGAAVADSTVALYLAAAGLALTIVAFLGFDIYFEVHRNGQTPGKKLAGIRVMLESGAPVDVRAACLRNLLALVDFLPGFYLLGALAITLTQRGQRLGDLAAGTIVVRERALQPPDELAERIAELAAPEFAFTAEQLAACAPDGGYILRSFFQRGRDMEPQSRAKLAARLADEFLKKTAWQPAFATEDSAKAVSFLASLHRDLEHFARHG